MIVAICAGGYPQSLIVSIRTRSRNTNGPDPRNSSLVIAASRAGLATRGLTPPASRIHASPVGWDTPTAAAAAVTFNPRISPAKNSSRHDWGSRPPHGRPTPPWVSPTPSGPPARWIQQRPVFGVTPTTAAASATDLPDLTRSNNTSQAAVPATTTPPASGVAPIPRDQVGICRRRHVGPLVGTGQVVVGADSGSVDPFHQQVTLGVEDGLPAVARVDLPAVDLAVHR